MAFKNPNAEIAAREQVMLRAYGELLSSNPIGNWGSDHNEEAKSFQGWNYTAIAAIGRQAAQAVGFVYANADTRSSTVRKTFKKSRGTF